MDTIRSNYEKCVQAHHRRSDHHLEHFQFPPEARMLMTCHLLGRVLARGRKHHKNLTLEECLHEVEEQNWKDWQFALKDKLPEKSSSAVEWPEKTPKTFDVQEYQRLLDPQFSWIDELESVKRYIRKQMALKHAIQDIHHRITTQYDPRFSLIEDRIQDYNLDQLRPDRIRAYTLYYSRHALGTPQPSEPESDPASKRDESEP